MKRMLLYTMIIFVCAGCWDRRELNELAIVSAIGFDLDGEGYEVTLQIVNPEEVSNQKTGYDSPITTYTDTGRTVMEAIRRLTKQMPRQAYFSHLRMVVISEELAKAGFSDVIDFLLRDHEMRSDFYIIVSKATNGRTPLEVLTSLENIPANKLFHSLEISQKVWGSTAVVNVNDLVATLVSEGEQLVLSSISVEGPLNKGEVPDNVKKTNEPVTLKYSGLAVFDKDRLIGWLNDKEGESYGFMMNNIKNTVIDVPCSDGSIGIEIFTSRSKVKGDIKNGKPSIKIEVESLGNIADVECKVDLTKLEEFNKIERDAGNVLKKEMEQLIQKAQHELKVDIFGFGEEIHRTAPKLWREIEDQWDQEFEQLPVDVEVNIKIKHKSTMKKSFLEDAGE